MAKYLLSVLILLLSPLTSTAIPHLRTELLTSEESGHRPDPSPTTIFEVTRPIPLPFPEKKCSALLLRHDFAFTFGQPPVTAPYRPPSCLRRRHAPLPRAVLEWSAASRGRQFDRIFGVWLAGAELLRSCTAEPNASGILWTIQKDITKYSSLLSRPQTLTVYLGNLVDKTYTGIYHVNVSIHFYFPSAASSSTRRQPGFASPADLILPVSRHPVPSDNNGLWFTIQNSADVQSAAIAIPRNSYRAVLEVYLSFHSDDEFWYSNPPNDYVSANNLTAAGNSPFREVVVTLDGDVVGAIWPFTVVYTGGINPNLWRPITGIGSFDLPSYDIEITPFLGKILDGKPHTFGFGVTNSLSFWLVDANLHLWLDSKSSYTLGELIKYEAPKFSPSLVSKFEGPDGQFTTTASRQISSTGWVKSSYGEITTHLFQKFDYENFMQFTGGGSFQTVNQTTDSSYRIYAKSPSSVLYSEQVYRNFPFYLYRGTTDEIGGNYSVISDVSLGFNTKKITGERSGFSFSSLRNSQKGEVNLTVSGNLVIGGIVSNKQVYKYESTDGCYSRNVSSRNFTILYDTTDKSCTEEGSPLTLPFPN